MKSILITSSAAALLVLTPAITPITLNAEPKQHSSTELDLLNHSIKEIFQKFEESIDLLKQQLTCLSPKSTVKLSVVCKNIRETIDRVDALFIEPMRIEMRQLKGTKLEHSNYAKLIGTLLALCAELKKDFDLIYLTLHAQLQEKKSAIVIAKHIKPIIDNIISDEKFKHIDMRLAEAHTYAQSYDVMIEIKPEHQTLLDIIETDRPNLTYQLTLADAFGVMRTALELLRKECRKPAATSQGEILRIIRSRL